MYLKMWVHWVKFVYKVEMYFNHKMNQTSLSTARSDVRYVSYRIGISQYAKDNTIFLYDIFEYCIALNDTQFFIGT